MNILHTSSTLYFYYEFYDIQNFKGKKKLIYLIIRVCSV